MQPFTDTYAQIKARPAARQVIRAAALSLASVGQRLSGARRALEHKPRVQVLIMHHVFRDEQTAFRRLLRELAKSYQFIGYSQAVDRILQGQIDRPYLAFSFDDGFKNCLDAAAILEDHGVGAMFFVCPNTIGLTDHHAVAQHCRERLNMPPIEHMSWDDLAQLRRRGHEIGSHTLSHLDMGQAPIEQIRDELARSRQVLIDRLGAVEHFAWPYGQWHHFQPACRDAVFDAGYRSCASGVRGAHANKQPMPDPRALCLRREHVLPAWPLAHTLYLLTRSAAKPLDAHGHWPWER